MSFNVCKLFCCFLTGWIEGTRILAIMNSLLRSLHDLAVELILGKIMYKFDKQCKFYILGQGSTYLFIYLFIYLLFFILLLNCVAANTFGIWNLRNTGKSVTNWVTHTLLWKVWTQESFQKYVEFDRPRERSHCQQQQSYSGLRSPGWSNSTYTCYCTHYININLSPSRCFPLHCLFQAMAWIDAIDSVTHYVFLLQNVSLNAILACRCINWLTHQWKKLDLIKRSRCDQRFYFNVILPFLT